MKRHIINFLLLAFIELGICGAALFFGLRFSTLSKSQQRQADLMRQAHSVFVADQNALSSQAAEGVTYREYKAQWEARMKEYDAPSKVLEILNAEASRAGVASPRLSETKGVANVFDMTTFGRLNELTRWLASAESRIDLLVIDEVVLTSQVDASLSLSIRSRLLGDLETKPAGPVAPAATTPRRAKTPKK